MSGEEGNPGGGRGDGGNPLGGGRQGNPGEGVGRRTLWVGAGGEEHTNTIHLVQQHTILEQKIMVGIISNYGWAG